MYYIQYILVGLRAPGGRAAGERAENRMLASGLVRADRVELSLSLYQSEVLYR